MWWLIFPALIVLYLAVVLVRTAAFKPKEHGAKDVGEVDIDEAKAVSDLAEMVRCKTVSYRDSSLIDEGEFDKFRALLHRLYPNVHRVCTLERIGKSGLLYRLKGENDSEPSIFMAHYDVVPANEEAWSKAPFEGIIEDGVLWGRGTLDTKGTLCGVMESAEKLIASGFTPKNDMYFAFAGDEEIAGETAPAIVEVLRSRGIEPGIVLDEGGAVVDNVFPGVKSPCALIGIAEKGMMDVELSIEGAGGHASTPPVHTPVGVLANAVTKIEGKPFARKLSKPVAEMFDTLGRRSTFVYRMIFANLWCFLPVLDSLCKKKGGELNAMMRTTCAFTMMEGSKASNVIPPKARVVANMRIITGDTDEGCVQYLKSVVKDGNVNFRVIHSMNPSRESVTTGKAWEKLKDAAAATWPGAIVSPYLMMACSDSRHYCKISDKVYRFSAMALSKEERGMIHGNDERIPVETIAKTVKFYVRLMQSL